MMKLGTDYTYRWGSRRLLALSELIDPILIAWANDPESRGSGVTVSFIPLDHKECGHSMHVFPRAKKLPVLREDPRWHVFSRRES